MSLTTPIPDGSKLGSTADANSDHAQWVTGRGLTGVKQFGTYYNMRGQRYLTTTDYKTFNQNTAAAMAACRNPTGSGKWVFFDVLEFGAVGAVGRFTRYGGGTFSVTSNASMKPVYKTDGTAMGSATEGALEVYTPDAPGYSASGGAVRKVAPMGDARPYFVFAYGSAILRPGQHVYWVTNETPGGGSGTYDAYINFEWVAIDETEAAAMVAAAQAMPSVLG